MTMETPDRTGGGAGITRQRIALVLLFVLGAFYLGSIVYLKVKSVDYVVAAKAIPLH